MNAGDRYSVVVIVALLSTDTMRSKKSDQGLLPFLEVGNGTKPQQKHAHCNKRISSYHQAIYGRYGEEREGVWCPKVDKVYGVFLNFEFRFLSPESSSTPLWLQATLKENRNCRRRNDTAYSKKRCQCRLPRQNEGKNTQRQLCS